MHVQVNTSNGVRNAETLEQWATEHLNDKLARFRQEITAVEVQLSDETQGEKGGLAEKRCMMEARVTGREPIAVTHFAQDQDLAFRGATEKLARAIEHAQGKADRKEHRSRETIRRDADALS